MSATLTNYGSLWATLTNPFLCQLGHSLAINELKTDTIYKHAHTHAYTHTRTDACMCTHACMHTHTHSQTKGHLLFKSPLTKLVTRSYLITNNGDRSKRKPLPKPTADYQSYSPLNTHTHCSPGQTSQNVTSKSTRTTTQSL